jgi:hypothetical protein
VGPPASVTTAVVAPTGDDPKAPVVLSADRYGFHDQATLLVVTFSEAVTASTAQNPANYTVLVSANGTTLAVPIARVYYNPDTHEATLRVTRRIYIFRPWMLLVRDGITGVNSKSLDGDGDHVAGGNATIRMSRRNLAGSASQAPGADHVGILNIPHPSPTSRMKQVASQPRRVAVSLLRDNRRARH